MVRGALVAHTDRMRELLLGAAVAAAGFGCADGHVGPVGPGGKATVFHVGELGFEAVDVRVGPEATEVEDGRWARVVQVEGQLADGSERVRLELDLETNRLNSLPAVLDVHRSVSFVASEEGPDFPDAPGLGPVAGVRFFGPCTTCALTDGQQRFEGHVSVLYLDSDRIELSLDLRFEGRTPRNAAPQSHRIEGYVDARLD